MSTSIQQPLLPAAPRAEVFSVTELIEDLLAGRIRIPAFQRPWKWKREQILALLDSLYRGYPIGSLLFWQRQQGSERLFIGPREIVAAERSDARAVIDGQQRLTSLLGTLAHPDPRSNPDDVFVAFFDPSTDRFLQSPRRGESLPGSWVPVSRLLDAADLQDWLFERPLFQQNKELRRKVLEAGKRVREARIPTYIVEAEDEQIPREIYRRMNRGGSPMEEVDVFNSIVGRTSQPGKIEDLEREAESLGMGKAELRRHKLLQCVMAVAGLDVTRRLDDQHDPRNLQESLEATAPALRSALVFLENEAKIPHLRLLPYPFPLIVLCRFFHFFPQPLARSRLLLVRWVWRGMMTGKHEHNERSSLRASVQAVQEKQEELSVQRLLSLVPRERPDNDWWLEARFDGRSAASRIAGLWLASQEPREIGNGTKIDIKQLLDENGAESFRPFAAFGKKLTKLSTSAAGRVLHPKGIRPQRLVELARNENPDSLVILASHGINGPALDALREEHWSGVLLHRRVVLQQGMAGLAARLAGWSDLDRPSISFLLAQGEDQESAA